MNMLFFILGVCVLVSVFDVRATEMREYTCDTTYRHNSYEGIAVNANVIVADSEPAGTIIWRTPVKAMSYNCWLGANEFSTRFFFNPENKSFDPDIEVGVTINGWDYRPSLVKDISANNFYSKNSLPGQTTMNAYKDYNVSIFIVKKTKANTTSKTKNIVISNYVPYQVGWAGSRSAGDRLSVRVENFTADVLSCSSTVAISPSVIDFGEVNSSGAAVGKEIQRVHFALSEQRVCQSSATYGLNGILRPVGAARLVENMGTLVPGDNDSVGISIFEAESQALVRFNNDFVVIPRVATTQNSKQFEASLKWRTSTPKLGRFNAGATLDVYYK